MSVIMTLRVQGDPKKVEQLAADDPGKLSGIAEAAKGHGAIGHRFYGSDDGWILVLDEWPDEQSFRSFYDHHSHEIGSVMEEAGVTSEPEIRFWRKLETNDDIGWGA